MFQFLAFPSTLWIALTGYDAHSATGQHNLLVKVAPISSLDTAFIGA